MARPLLLEGPILLTASLRAVSLESFHLGFQTETFHSMIPNSRLVLSPGNFQDHDEEGDGQEDGHSAEGAGEDPDLVL